MCGGCGGLGRRPGFGVRGLGCVGGGGECVSLILWRLG